MTDPDTPVLADVTGECSATAVAPTTTDNCAGTITGTTSDPLTYTEQGSYVVTWNFDDGNGNSIDVTQNVIIDDITAPTATCANDVVTCNGIVGSIRLTEVYDNCTTPGITYELTGATIASGVDDASSEVFNPGVTTVTYTVIDGNGNSSQYALTVTYQEIGNIVISQAEDELIVETEGTYQWMNCADSSLIEGQTESSFTPVESGEYAVIVTQGTCSDTSECYSVNILGVYRNSMNEDLQIYPNPVQDILTIDMVIENTNVTIIVFNTDGQKVLIKEIESTDKTELDVRDLKNGIYLIHIDSDQLNRNLRIIKK